MNYPDTTTEPTAHTRKAASEASFQNHTDAQLAYQLVVVGRQDINLTQMQYAARDRILKLSCELWDARQRIAELERREREAFKAGWRTNAAISEHPESYLEGCEQVDFDEYRLRGLDDYLQNAISEAGAE